MRFSIILMCLICAVSLILLQGCATIFTGYYDTVELVNAPEDIQVFTREGVEIPVKQETRKVMAPVRFGGYEYQEKRVSKIEVRANLDPVLILKHGAQEKRVHSFGKIHAGWLLLDILFAGLPCFVDGLTGNWNTYDPIDASFK